jgi:hypothetical protein
MFIKEITKDMKKERNLDEELLIWIKDSPYTIMKEVPNINPVIVYVTDFLYISSQSEIPILDHSTS